MKPASQHRSARNGTAAGCATQQASVTAERSVPNCCTNNKRERVTGKQGRRDLELTCESWDAPAETSFSQLLKLGDLPCLAHLFSTDMHL